MVSLPQREEAMRASYTRGELPQREEAKLASYTRGELEKWLRILALDGKVLNFNDDVAWLGI